MTTLSRQKSISFSSPADPVSRLSLTRCDHSLSVINNRAYIFGGETTSGKLASNDVHAITLASAEKPEPDYSIIPAIADVGGDKVPAARRKHAACSFNVCAAIFGGVQENGETIDEEFIWLFNTGKSAWEKLDAQYSDTAKPQARSGASLHNHRNNLVLYGGRGASGEALKDAWLFSYVEKTWKRLPDAPVSSSSAALCNGILHLISGTDSVSSELHLLELSPKKESEWSWHTMQFPTNPLTPGPRPRVGAGLLPCSTGHGRNYLAYLFGARGSEEPPKPADPEQSEKEAPNADPPYWSDMWTYQLPSIGPDAKATTSLSDAIKPAKIKDAIRGALGYDTGGHSWAEVEVLPPKDLEAAAGKVHPGPRGFFGCDVMEDHQSVVIWGGVNAKGEKEGDGWVIKME